MDQAVTYVELHFARDPPPQKGPDPPSAPSPPPPPETGGREGELTYENVQAGPRGQRSEETPKESNEPDRRMKKAAGLVIAATVLFLLATAVGLGVLYGQVSGQLHRASQDHADQTRVLERRVSIQNESLAKMEVQLHQTEMDLNSTRVALQESLVATERTQKHLEKVEEQLREANRSLGALKREKERTEAELGQATSCQEIGCCPTGWMLFRWKCLWISQEKKTWEESKKDCEKRSSRLMILEDPWDPGSLWQKAQSSLESDQYWIGLRKWMKWYWVDETPHPRPESLGECGRNGYCGQLRRGTLRQCHCGTSSRYICERTASPEWPPGHPGP